MKITVDAEGSSVISLETNMIKYVCMSVIFMLDKPK